jgi:hypothetical protein
MNFAAGRAPAGRACASPASPAITGNHRCRYDRIRALAAPEEFQLRRSGGKHRARAPATPPAAAGRNLDVPLAPQRGTAPARARMAGLPRPARRAVTSPSTPALTPAAPETGATGAGQRCAGVVSALHRGSGAARGGVRPPQGGLPRRSCQSRRDARARVARGPMPCCGRRAHAAGEGADIARQRSRRRHKGDRRLAAPPGTGTVRRCTTGCRCLP